MLRLTPGRFSAAARATEGGFEHLRYRNAERDETRLLGRIPGAAGALRTGSAAL